MKHTLQTFFVSVLFLSYSEKTTGQPIYTLALPLPVTYSTSCGTIGLTQWAVNNSNCTLNSMDVVTAATPAAQTYLAVVALTGSNMDSGDSTTIRYSVNGIWVTERVYHAFPLICALTHTFTITAPANSSICVSVNMVNNDGSEQWRIPDGGITLLRVISPLPVELLNFNGQCAGNTIELSWLTASESGSGFFTLEKSIDGKSFLAAYKITAAGNSSTPKQYNFTDKEPVEGNNYYRLRQTDQNGQESYCSDIIAFKYLAPEPPFEIYPNPVYHSKLKFHSNENQDEMLLVVIDSKGRKIFSTAVSTQDQKIPIDLSDEWNKLPPGMYLVHGIFGKERYQQKIFVR